MKFAYRQVGKPYQWGGAGPRTYDCSGLVMAAWRKGGLSLPHRADLQHRVIRRKVGLRHLRPGDLVFFSGDHHVGIYVGRRHFLHAPHTGARVQRGTLSGWRLRAFAGAARPGAPAYHSWPHWVRTLARHRARRRHTPRPHGHVRRPHGRPGHHPSRRRTTGRGVPRIRGRRRLPDVRDGSGPGRAVPRASSASSASSAIGASSASSAIGAIGATGESAEGDPAGGFRRDPRSRRHRSDPRRRRGARDTADSRRTRTRTRSRRAAGTVPAAGASGPAPSQADRLRCSPWPGTCCGRGTTPRRRRPCRGPGAAYGAGVGPACPAVAASPRCSTATTNNGSIATTTATATMRRLRDDGDDIDGIDGIDLRSLLGVAP